MRHLGFISDRSTDFTFLHNIHTSPWTYSASSTTYNGKPIPSVKAVQGIRVTIALHLSAEFESPCTSISVFLHVAVKHRNNFPPQFSFTAPHIPLSWPVATQGIFVVMIVLTHSSEVLALNLSQVTWQSFCDSPCKVSEWVLTYATTTSFQIL